MFSHLSRGSRGPWRKHISRCEKYARPDYGGISDGGTKDAKKRLASSRGINKIDTASSRARKMLCRTPEIAIIMPQSRANADSP